MIYETNNLSISLISWSFSKNKFYFLEIMQSEIILVNLTDFELIQTFKVNSVFSKKYKQSHLFLNV